MAILTTYLSNLTVPLMGAPFVSLHTTSTSASEITGLASYVRRAATWIQAGSTLVNNSVISFPVAGADWGTIRCLGGQDAISSGNAYWICPLDAAYFVKSGDQLIFDLGSIRLALV